MTRLIAVLALASSLTTPTLAADQRMIKTFEIFSPLSWREKLSWMKEASALYHQSCDEIQTLGYC